MKGLKAYEEFLIFSTSQFFDFRYYYSKFFIVLSVTLDESNSKTFDIKLPLFNSFFIYND